MKIYQTLDMKGHTIENCPSILEPDGTSIELDENNHLSATGIGAKGDSGDSAYALAVQQGFEGTLDEWLASLHGEDGTDGKSTYELAVAGGYTGTQEEYLASLHGADGANGQDGLSAFQQAVAAGYTGTEAEWLASLNGTDGVNGKDGLSAYQQAVAAGFTGTESEWLESLKGTDGQNGTDGLSAYQQAVAAGFDGSESAWLESLKGETGAKGDTGDAFNIQKTYATIVAMVADYDTEDVAIGQFVMISTADVDEEDNAKVYVKTQKDLTSDTPGWAFVVDMSGATGIKGDPGDQGPRGYQGLSAYEIAYSKDSTIGSEVEWLASLKGKSAYQIAVENGYSGTESAWLASLKAKNEYELAVESGFEGSQQEYLDSLKGDSAYTVAQNNGYEGTESAWLASLKGADGTDGEDAPSNYELAVQNGFTGTESEWLASLKGKSAYEVAVANGYTGTESAWLASLKGDKGDTGEVSTPATTTSLGSVKIGSGLNIGSDGTLDVKAATTSTIGGVKVGSELSVSSDGTLRVPNMLKIEVSVINSSTTYTLDLSSSNYAKIIVIGGSTGSPICVFAREYVGIWKLSVSTWTYTRVVDTEKTSYGTTASYSSGVITVTQAANAGQAFIVAIHN